MSHPDFKICPMCGGEIEHKVDILHHPVRGDIPNVPYAVCKKCGEIFLGRDSYQVIRDFEEHHTLTASTISRGIGDRDPRIGQGSCGGG